MAQCSNAKPAFAADPVMLPHQGCSPPKLPEAHKTKNAKHQMCQFFTFVFHTLCFSMFFFLRNMILQNNTSFCRFSSAPQTNSLGRKWTMWPPLPQRQLGGLRSHAWLQQAHRICPGLPSTEPPGLIHRAKPSHSNDNT